MRINWRKVAEKAATVLKEADLPRGDFAICERLARAIGGRYPEVGARVELGAETVKLFGQEWEVAQTATRKG